MSLIAIVRGDYRMCFRRIFNCKLSARCDVYTSCVHYSGCCTLHIPKPKTRYTAAQPEQSRLSESQWHHLQELFTWTAPNDEKLLAVIFLLAVKGATKYRWELLLNCGRPKGRVLHYPLPRQSCSPQPYSNDEGPATFSSRTTKATLRTL